MIAKTIMVTGAIQANGGHGGQTTVDADGGEGAGGSILLKGQAITLGTNLVTALGGVPVDKGGSGGDGRIRVEYCDTLTGSTDPPASVQQISCFPTIPTPGARLDTKPPLPTPAREMITLPAPLPMATCPASAQVCNIAWIYATEVPTWQPSNPAVNPSYGLYLPVILKSP